MSKVRVARIIVNRTLIFARSSNKYINIYIYIYRKEEDAINKGERKGRKRGKRGRDGEGEEGKEVGNEGREEWKRSSKGVR